MSRPTRAALVEALDDLQRCEARYRQKHDLHGDNSLAAGQAWDHLRRAGHRARQLLMTEEPHHEPDQGVCPEAQER